MSIPDIVDCCNFDDTTILSEYFQKDCSADLGTVAKIKALEIASYLNDPVCKVREYFYTFYTLNQTCESTWQKVLKAAYLSLGIISCSLLTPFATPFGLALRGIVVSVESKPYIYLEKSCKGKRLPEDRKITLVSHNECYVPGGYSITDGQVTPSSDKSRIDENIKKIKELDPDIVCLFEVSDIFDAEYIASKLPDYPFIIPVAGLRAIGPSSMLWIGSKYEIAKDSIEFIPFEKGTELSGRASYSQKGFLSFDIKNQGEKAPFATIISTHLQHSEIPAKPEESEILSRVAEMNKIVKKIQSKINRGLDVIFTGDLNQEEEELNKFFDLSKIDWLRRDDSVKGIPTWGGDEWCANLMGKPSSGPLVLDYTFIAGKARGICTKIIETNYSGSKFRQEATSDHFLLFSTIILGGTS